MFIFINSSCAFTAAAMWRCLFLLVAVSLICPNAWWELQILWTRYNREMKRPRTTVEQTQFCSFLLFLMFLSVFVVGSSWSRRVLHALMMTVHGALFFLFIVYKSGGGTYGLPCSFVQFCTVLWLVKLCSMPFSTGVWHPCEEAVLPAVCSLLMMCTYICLRKRWWLALK